MFTRFHKSRMKTSRNLHRVWLAWKKIFSIQRHQLRNTDCQVISINRDSWELVNGMPYTRWEVKKKGGREINGFILDEDTVTGNKKRRLRHGSKKKGKVIRFTYVIVRGVLFLVFVLKKKAGWIGFTVGMVVIEVSRVTDRL